MANYYKHLFLIPLKNANSDLIYRLKEYASFNAEKFGFVVSIQDAMCYEQYISVFQLKKNIFLVNPKQDFERTEHWKFVIEYARENIIFDSFSYYFSGDELRLKGFPALGDDADIYVNDYFIDEWSNCKENASIEQINKKAFRDIVSNNLYKGKPILAPLQKIIFSNHMAEKIFFDNEYTFISDQLLIEQLIKSGAKAAFIKSPFYKLNKKERFYSNEIRLFEKIKQQIYLYAKFGCLLACPAIVLRTLIKHFFKIY
ncbi:hypothetical protein [Leminorella grimontii]|uniref:hypothetical protein n=1 Tax=Leminorella grimontii TaxID=82981 RepID=UPI002085DCEA|nr:hypothetical protein [Leminorella grimontii]GKX58431.1 hypothetical protein SOASR031_07460 [Leminorella grimontii]